MSRVSADLIHRLREARERLAATNINDPALAVCVSGLERIEGAVSRPLRVVILGEYNSGKTAVTDLLLGDGLLPTSVVSNTQVPVLITHAEKAALYGVDQDGTLIRIDSDDDDPLLDIPYRALQIGLPIEWLRDYQILDTPSMVNADTFSEEADIVIWCTVATRAWTESERATWSMLPLRCRRNGLLVVTHRYALQGEEEERQVTDRLRSLTDGLFRDVVLVEAAGEHSDALAGHDSGADLRGRLMDIAQSITDRRAQKGEKIVRKLARLTFHEFAREEVRSEVAPLLASWETGAGRLMDELRQGQKPAPVVIEELLRGYAAFAERLRPGAVMGDAISPAPSSSRALTKPVRWPEENAAVGRMVGTLVSDLTGLLRMLSGTSMFMDPNVRAEYEAARAVLLSLADLDGAFHALGRLVGEKGPGASPSRHAIN